MKIIIAGAGKVGRTLTNYLASEGYDLTLIDQKENVLEQTQDIFDVMTIQGNAASMEALEAAGVKNADLLIAATGADEINLLCCMTAHFMNDKLHTIARIRTPEYTQQIYDMRENFALSMTVNPEKQAAEEIERLLRYPNNIRRETFPRGRMDIIEIRIDSSSKICNVSLIDLNKIINCKILVCTVVRDGKSITPSGDFIIREGDRIFVTAPSDNLSILLSSLGIVTNKIKNIMVCGGGRISYYLTEMLLKHKINVKVIERNLDRCISLAEDLPNANIIHGDASDRSLLDSEGIASTDALVTLTGFDEMNLLISLYGNNLKVKNIVTKLSHESSSSIFDNISIGNIICPKELVSDTIVQYVRGMRNQKGKALAVHTFADGNAEGYEFLIDESTTNCGVPLKDLPIKKNALIVGIKHGPTTEIPGGNSTYEQGDIVVVVSDGAQISQFNDIFK